MCLQVLHLMYESTKSPPVHLHIYNGSILKVLPIPTNTVDLIGQFIVHILDIYILHASGLLQIYYCYISLPLMKSPLMLSTVRYWRLFKYCTSVCLDHISVVSGILITAAMALYVVMDAN